MRGKVLLPTIVGSILGLTVVAWHADAGAAVPSLWDTPLESSSSACAICTDCGGMHATVEGSDYDGLHAEPLECNHSGTCEAQHGPCSVAFSSPEVQKSVLRELVAAGIAGQRSAAIRTANRYPEAIVYVEERDAVQVLGCEGQVALHIPFGPTTED